MLSSQINFCQRGNVSALVVVLPYHRPVCMAARGPHEEPARGARA
jgi:hypothetical protein